MFKPGSRINRIRHNRGFGIQSPSAFFFITQVLREKLPYYAYDTLDEIAEECREMSCRSCRILFRIANHFAPESCITVESATAACAISSARRSIPKQFITEETARHTEAARHLEACNCTHMAGDTIKLLEESIRKNNGLGLLYIGQCPKQHELLHTALEHANKDSVIIVEGIHRNREQEAWWLQSIANPKTIVTYDMYSMGMLFFNDERYKQNYTLMI